MKGDYEKHESVLLMIKQSQDAEREQREQAKEAKRFVTVRGAQWDKGSAEKMEGRFRGTFDMCSPIIDQIAGEIEQTDFAIRVSPAGGEATKEKAKLLDGIVRNIRNISNFQDSLNACGRANVISGFDCFEIVQDWVDADTFDQDLFIRRVPNAIDSVWFDLGSTEQDRSDSGWGVKLATIPKAEYDERWPEGSGLSVDDSSVNDYYTQGDAKETVTVAKLYYRKAQKVQLVRMTNGAIYKDDADFQSVKDELAQAGIFVETDEDGNEKRRTRDGWQVYSRMLDGGGWLSDEELTVFEFIPLVPVYGNFDIVDNNVTYSGKLENIMDTQRSLNYAMSRDIEDGALSPSPTVWMTQEMGAGYDYSGMNIDRAPIRYFNIDPENPNLVPQYTGGPQSSQGLQQTVLNMQQMINLSSNTFDAGQGNAAATQSGVAGLQQIEQGNVGNIKWFNALKISCTHIGRILINAIPKTYDGTRVVRVLEENGEGSMESINQTVFDSETRRNIVLNDLTVGQYDTVCEIGPAFNSAQKEAARSFETMAGIIPEFAQTGMDIWLKNRNEPGMALMAERFRKQLLNAGIIPEAQWTEEERAEIAQAQQEAMNQPPQPDPVALAAQAEMEKAKADQMEVERKGIEGEKTTQLKIAELQIKQQELELRKAESQSDAEIKMMKNQIEEYKAQIEAVKAGAQVNKIEVDTAKTLKEIQELDVESLAALASGLVGG
jgi:hypothetical protein